MLNDGFFETLSDCMDLTDPRVDRGKNFCLKEMVTLSICGTICGANTWADIERFCCAHQAWFEKYLELPHGIPSHDTFGRVFRRLDTAEFYNCVIKWIQEIDFVLKDKVVSIDGKTLRGSHDRANGQAPLHVVNAWASELKVCLGQVSVDSKSNEIPAAQELLGLLQLEGAVVTMDAMHCQKKTAQRIHDAGADYVLPVKGNQEKLHDRLRQETDKWVDQDFDVRGLRQHSQTEKSRDRVETRTCVVKAAPADLKKQWPGLKTIGMIVRTRELRDGTESSETTVFISSRSPKVREHVNFLRQHWCVENELHYTLDVTFAEDASRIRRENGAAVTSGFRRVALSILKMDTTVKDNIHGKRMRAGWDTRNLESILQCFQKANGRLNVRLPSFADRSKTL